MLPEAPPCSDFPPKKLNVVVEIWNADCAFELMSIVVVASALIVVVEPAEDVVVPRTMFEVLRNMSPTNANFVLFSCVGDVVPMPTGPFINIAA